MSWKDSVENHPLWYAGTILIAGFVGGIAVRSFLIETAPTSPSADSTSWSDAARASGWIPKTQCPAYPIAAQISAPGDGATIPVQNFEVSNSYAETDLVIQVSRPLPSENSVGYIVNEIGSSNYYVSFPAWDSGADRRVFRLRGQIPLPFRLNPKTAGLRFWAIIADDENKIGTVYSSVDQIKATEPNTIVSPPVSATIQGSSVNQ